MNSAGQGSFLDATAAYGTKLPCVSPSPSTASGFAAYPRPGSCLIAGIAVGIIAPLHRRSAGDRAADRGPVVVGSQPDPNAA